MSETGSIKFRCDHVPKPPVHFAEFDELNHYRRRLIDLAVVGIDASGIGFGNLSVRVGLTSEFYITGTGTGGLSALTPTDFSKVVAYDFAKNWLRCEGTRLASSESLTHAAVYESDLTVRAVIHCHDEKLWGALLHSAPATPGNADYGTPEMAYAVKDLLAIPDKFERRIIVMTAHRGGLITFGENPAKAFSVLIQNGCAERAHPRRRFQIDD